MFLWGQTVAFDSIVRDKLSQKEDILTDKKWQFEHWKEAMILLQNDLRRSPKIVRLFKNISREKYGTDLIVPYGQFIDLYYWTPKNNQNVLNL